MKLTNDSRIRSIMDDPSTYKNLEQQNVQAYFFELNPFLHKLKSRIIKLLNDKFNVEGKSLPEPTVYYYIAQGRSGSWNIERYIVLGLFELQPKDTEFAFLFAHEYMHYIFANRYREHIHIRASQNGFEEVICSSVALWVLNELRDELSLSHAGQYLELQKSMFIERDEFLSEFETTYKNCRDNPNSPWLLWFPNLKMTWELYELLCNNDTKYGWGDIVKYNPYKENILIKPWS